MFVDTSAFVPLFDRSEIHHAPALAVRQRLLAARRKFFTSNFVIAETHALILKRRGPHVALIAPHEIDASLTFNVRISVRDERRA